jgi:lipopolysaccharide/colanic/teichoic acid biosynthesis glycosyltransferase
VLGARSDRVVRGPRFSGTLDAVLTRLLDWVLSAALLILSAPLVLGLAIAIKLEGPGPVFYRSRRVGLGGREFTMLKFRKMPDGASGPPLTAPDDERFTSLGRFLARTKLDELPQLWNVLRGDMSLVGPRPEDPVFVERFRPRLEPVLRVKPGITGLSQLAFAREPEILDPENREEHYVSRILPQKIHLDTLYAERRTALVNLRILCWTAVAVLLRREVAVDRATGALGIRRRPSPRTSPAPVETPPPELAAVPAEQVGA